MNSKAKTQRKAQPDSNSQNQNDYEQLFRIGTNGLTIVLALVVGKVGQGIVDVTTRDSIPPQSLFYSAVAFCTLLTILFSIVGIIVTVNYAHGELNIPFKPIYLVTNLLSISLPFYLAVNAISSAMAPIAKAEDFSTRLFTEGLIAMLIGFISLLIYLLVIYRFENPHLDEKKPLPNRYYIWVGIFQTSGIAFSIGLFLGLSLGQQYYSALLALSILGVLGSSIYLVVTPILKVRFQRGSSK